MQKPFFVPRILGDDEDFPISPNDIDVTNEFNFVGAFDVPDSDNDNPNDRYNNQKMNEGATIVVNTCQKQGHWGPCNPYELTGFHEEATFSLTTFLKGRHQFNGLVIRGEDGLWRVTDKFIIYCYMAAPKIRTKPRQLPPTANQIEG